MKEIELTKNKIVIVDDEDYDFLNRWNWCAYKHKLEHNFYARRSAVFSDGKQRTIPMHRLILGLQYGDKGCVDHINGNSLDNRKENLRVCSSIENNRNRKKQKNSSGYKGVAWHKRIKKWQAQVSINKLKICLGYFDNPLDAAKVYDQAVIKYHGEFASMNFKKAEAAE